MTNYNTTLQTNNTDLQAILSVINELPEAGGEGQRIAFGRITLTEGRKSKDSVIANVSGLSFSPTTVYLIAYGGTNYTSSISNYLLCGLMFNDMSSGTSDTTAFLTAGNSTSKVRGFNMGSYNSIIMNNDGFTWSSSNSNLYTSSSYIYIALG